MTRIAIETETKLAEYKSSWLEARNGRSHAFSLTCVSETPAKTKCPLMCLSAGIRGEVLVLKIGPKLIYRLLRKQLSKFGLNRNNNGGTVTIGLYSKDEETVCIQARAYLSVIMNVNSACQVAIRARLLLLSNYAISALMAYHFGYLSRPRLFGIITFGCMDVGHSQWL